MPFDQEPRPTVKTRPRVLLVDDHLLFAEAIRAALEQDGLEVLPLAQSGSDAIKAARNYVPDLAIIDIGLPDVDGLDLGVQLRAEHPDIRILVVTALNSVSALRRTLDLGFSGYLTKDTSMDRFVTALRSVLAGEIVIPATLSQHVTNRLTQEEQDAALKADQLTRREREVLQKLADGSTSESIAAQLAVSRHTVRTHIQNILMKLQVSSRLEAAAFAIRYGLVESPSPGHDQDRERSGSATYPATYKYDTSRYR